jgi:ABC-type multidrug transport system fused ATPase/permease subunit
MSADNAAPPPAHRVVACAAFGLLAAKSVALFLTRRKRTSAAPLPKSETGQDEKGSLNRAPVDLLVELHRNLLRSIAEGPLNAADDQKQSSSHYCFATRWASSAVADVLSSRRKYSVPRGLVMGTLQRFLAGCASREPVDLSEQIVRCAGELAVLWLYSHTAALVEAVEGERDTQTAELELTDLRSGASKRLQSDIHTLLLCPVLTTSPAVQTLQCEIAGTLAALRCRCDKAAVRKRALMAEQVRSLAKYLFVSSPRKAVALALTGALTWMIAALQAAGHELRCAAEATLTPHTGCERARPSSSTPSDGATTRLSLFLARLPRPWVDLVVVLLFEVARMTATVALLRLTTKCIQGASSQHREEEKQRLFNALIRTPLSFFDTHDADDIEQMMYYCNDLEGVDVHLQRGLTELVTAAAAVAATTRAFSAADKAAVGASACVCLLLDAAIRWSASGGRDATETEEEGSSNQNDDEGDEEELENVVTGSSAARRRNDHRKGETLLLRRSEILAYVRDLRPLGADVALMDWWVCRLGSRQGRSTLQTLAAAVDGSFKLVKPLLHSVCVTAKWFLPIAAAVAVAGPGGSSGEFLRRCTAVRLASANTADFFERLLDMRRVAEVVAANAYKADRLLRIQDPKSWETHATIGEGEHGSREHIAAADSNDENEEKKHEAQVWSYLCSLGRLQGIRFDNVSFQYPISGADVASLRDVSFTIPLHHAAITTRPTLPTPHAASRDGEDEAFLVSIVGPSGSGKSTLLKLLLRLYEPSRGSIFLIFSGPRAPRGSSRADGGKEDSPLLVPLRQVPHRILRQRIFGYVPQRSVIFPSTMAQNISLEPIVSIRSRDVLGSCGAAAQASHAAELISRLPEGLLTVVSSSDSGLATHRLSGGEEQRVNIARAVYRRPWVLLLDEPTSGLDDHAAAEIASLLTGGHRHSSRGAREVEATEGSRRLDKRTAVGSAIAVTHDGRLVSASDMVIKRE